MGNCCQYFLKTFWKTEENYYNNKEKKVYEYDFKNKKWNSINDNNNIQHKEERE